MRKRILGALTILLALVGLWVLSASRIGARVEGCPQGCSTVNIDNSGSLKVLTLNVFHGYSDFKNLDQRLDHISEQIGRLGADVILLQEVPWRPGLGNGAQYIADRVGMNHIYLRANGNRWAILFEEGEAILSRYPLTEMTFSELRPWVDFFEHRVVLSAIISLNWGDVRFFVTHLTDGDEAINLAQVVSLKDFVEDSAGELKIIGGDFNALENSTSIEAITDDWMDTYRTVHADKPGNTCCIDELNSDPNEELEKRIDYIFLVWGPGHEGFVKDSTPVLNQPFELAGSWQWPSDHIGLLTTFELPH